MDLKAIPDFEQVVTNHISQFLHELDQVIQVPSVRGDSQVGAPFGIQPRRALALALDIAADYGFETHVVSDAVGYAQYGSNNKEYIGVLGHLDVVAAADDWDYPAFQLTLEDDMMYGRGVLDNKGPIMASLFALVLLKEQAVKLNKTVRIIFGTDEESGSSDIPMYLAKEEPPVSGYTPDCKFPVVYGERGMVGLEISQKITDSSLQQIETLSGNFDRSFIPDEATLKLKGEVVQQFNGVKAPSNAPDMADSVLPKIVEVCQKLTGQTGKFMRWVNAKLCQDYDGTSLDIAFEDVDSGKLQLSFYSIEMTDNVLAVDLSIRYPISVTESQLMSRIEKALLPEMTFEINRRFPSHVVDPKTPMIQTMAQVYEAVTHSSGEPVTTTGVTYARSMPNIVAFGPSFPGQKGIAHKGNEWMKQSEWLTNMAIDYYTIAELAK